MEHRNEAFVTSVGVMGVGKTRSVLPRTRYPTNAPNLTRSRRAWMPIMKLNIGDRVRVLDKGITMYHFPGKMNVPVEVAGLTGTIANDVSIHKGVKVSATLPYVVTLDEYPKSKTHFSENELEVIDDHPEKPDSNKKEDSK